MDQFQNGKLVSVQLLRIMAATYVSVTHLALAFANHVGEGLGWRPHDTQHSQMSVMVFFVLAGFLLVASTKDIAGTPAAGGAFWVRRAIRLLPTYWMATLGMVFWLVLIGIAVDPLQLFQSLVLFPYWDPQGGMRYAPILWTAWVVFDEMFLFTLFAAFLTLGRRRALLATSGALAVLSACSLIVDPPVAFLFFVTRPVMLMFVFGMALAWWREQGGQAPVALRVLALVATLPFLIWLEGPDDPTNGNFEYLFWAGVPVCLIVFAALAGPLRLPMPKAITEAGNMSYALYMLHLPIGWSWVVIYRQLVYPAEAWGFFASLVAVTFAISWVFYRYIEQPVTRWLTARLVWRRAALQA